MSIWKTRDESLAYLKQHEPSKLSVLERTFELIDDVVDAFESSPSPSDYSRACALALLKTKNLAIGAYGLALDGLAQESGALLRPLIEYAELLTYFRLFPEKASQAMWNTLPKAGERAKAIDSIYQGLRSHLNQNASHSSFSSYSLSHLIEPATFGLKKTQSLIPEVLATNIRDLEVQLQVLLREAILSLESSNPSAFPLLGGRYDSLRQRMLSVFAIADT